MRPLNELLVWTVNATTWLTLILGVATIIALFIGRLRQSRAFWLLFFGVNVIPVAGGLTALVLDVLEREQEFGALLDVPPAVWGRFVFIVASLAVLLWCVARPRPPAYVNFAVALLTAARMVEAFHLLISVVEDPEFFVESVKEGSLRTLARLMPILCCVLFLLFRVLFLRGSFEPETVSQPRRAGPSRACPRCRSVADSDAVFCTNCGTELPRSRQ